jgi:hypothetical protein
MKLKLIKVKANDKSYKIKMSKEMVENILKDGKVKGKELSPRQLNLFKAVNAFYLKPKLKPKLKKYDAPRLQRRSS